MSINNNTQFVKIRPKLIEETHIVLGRYKSGQELQNAIEKWQDEIILSAYPHEDVFETLAQANQSIIKMKKRYDNFLKSRDDLSTFAKLIMFLVELLLQLQLLPLQILPLALQWVLVL